MVIQLSQSSVVFSVKISCSGVPKSPAASSLFMPCIPLRPLLTRLLIIKLGLSVNSQLYKESPFGFVHSSTHSPSNQSTPGSYLVTNSCKQGRKYSSLYLLMSFLFSSGWCQSIIEWYIQKTTPYFLQASLNSFMMSRLNGVLSITS